MKVNFSQHKSNACEQVFPLYLTFQHLRYNLCGISLDLSLCEQCMDPIQKHHNACRVYLFSHLDSSFNFTFSCIYQLSQCSLRESFLCLKCMAPFRNHVLVNYSDQFSFTEQAKWHTLAVHLTQIWYTDICIQNRLFNRERFSLLVSF